MTFQSSATLLYLKITNSVQLMARKSDSEQKGGGEEQKESDTICCIYGVTGTTV